jgi:hypothetical protein
LTDCAVNAPERERSGLHIRTLSDRTGGKRSQTVHDIISDIIEWDEVNKAYIAGEGQSGERYIQRLGAADRMAEIEARWQHLPDGFHGERKLIKVHIQAVADTALVTGREDLCWLAIAAASAWLPDATAGEVGPTDTSRTYALRTSRLGRRRPSRMDP